MPEHSFAVDRAHRNALRFSKSIDHFEPYLLDQNPNTELTVLQLGIPAKKKRKTKHNLVHSDEVQLRILCPVPLYLSPGLPRPTKSQGRGAPVQKQRLAITLCIQRCLFYFPSFSGLSWSLMGERSRRRARNYNSPQVANFVLIRKASSSKTKST